VSENKRFLDIFRIKNIVNALTGFIETKVELYKIQFKEEIVKALSILILVVIFSMIGLLFIILISQFFSVLLNILLESESFGYLIVAFIYLIIGFIVYLKRQKILDSITNLMFPEEESENDIDYEQ
jgi:uncharacterized membrane protein YqjE